MIKVLIVDDEKFYRNLFKKIAEQAASQIIMADGIDSARVILRRETGVTHVILDHLLAHRYEGEKWIAITGEELIPEIKQAYPGVKIIYATGSAYVCLKADAVINKNNFSKMDILDVLQEPTKKEQDNG